MHLEYLPPKDKKEVKFLQTRLDEILKVKEADEDKLYRLRNVNNIVGQNERIRQDIKKLAKQRKEREHYQRVAYDTDDLKDTDSDKHTLPEILQTQYLHIGATVQTKNMKADRNHIVGKLVKYDELEEIWEVLVDCRTRQNEAIGRL